MNKKRKKRTIHAGHCFKCLRLYTLPCRTSTLCPKCIIDLGDSVLLFQIDRESKETLANKPLGFTGVSAIVDPAVLSKCLDKALDPSKKVYVVDAIEWASLGLPTIDYTLGGGNNA